MTLKIDGAVLFLGRLRRDGFRNVERVRLTNFRTLLPALRRAKIRSLMDDKRLLVQPENPDQLLLPFSSEAAG